ncbi:MAG TPA: cyclophilin-like family protein [Nitrososphaera sp.]|nr:cyclophilin-like family protein [Nitrososphaera sp.]
MKKAVSLEFSELHEKVAIELDGSRSLKTVMAIIGSLPIKVAINRWGDELYTDETPVRAEEENARSVVSLFDVAYWPEGSALCFFYGSTPISKEDKIICYSPVNMIGRITSQKTYKNSCNQLKKRMSTKKCRWCWASSRTWPSNPH